MHKHTFSSQREYDQPTNFHRFNGNPFSIIDRKVYGKQSTRLSSFPVPKLIRSSRLCVCVCVVRTCEVVLVRLGLLGSNLLGRLLASVDATVGGAAHQFLLLLLEFRFLLFALLDAIL